MKTLPMFNTSLLDPYTVGFDRIWDNVEKLNKQIGSVVPNYPPYNIVKTDDNSYQIEIAVAGFGKSNLDITLEGDTMTVTGKTEGADDIGEFLHKGIANRAFERKFTLDDSIEIKNAEMLNGMLKIFLERIIPEDKKPKKVEINDSEKVEKQLLTED